MKYLYTIFTLILIFSNLKVNGEYWSNSNLNGAAGDQYITLTWDHYEGAIGYNIRRNNVSDNPSAAVKEQINKELVLGTSYFDDELINFVEYRYYIQAVLEDGSLISSGIMVSTPCKEGEIYTFKGDSYMSRNLKAGSVYVVEENFNLKGSAKLRIDAGVVVKFKEGAKLTSETAYSYFISRTHEEPIVFTSYKDDEHGGDTNGDGDATKPQAGDWNTIQVPLWNANGIPYCKVLYATTGYTFPEVGDNELSHWVFQDCVNVIAFASNTIDNTQFSENDIIDCDNFMSGQLGTNFSAANNWFGDASGPYNASSNPEGKGCAMPDNITFTPFSEKPYLHPFVQNPIVDQEFKEDAGEVINIDLNTVFGRPINFDHQLRYSVEIEGESISAKIVNSTLTIETLDNKNGTNTIHLKANSRYYSTDKPYFSDLSFNVTLTPENDAPTAIQLTKNSIAENSVVGTEVGILTTVDPDANQTFTYTIPENEFFEIDGDKLISKKEFDYEIRDSYTVEIKVKDQDELSHTQTLTIAVVDVNEKPTDILLSNNRWFENSPIGTVIGEMTAVDEDANQSFTFTNIDPKFDVVGNKLVSNAELDKEALDEYLGGTGLNIVVTDQDGETYKKLFEIYYIDVNEAPTAIQLSNNNILENSGAGVVVGSLTATDEDRHETFTYSLAENDNFKIEGDKLLVAGNLNYEKASSHSLEITVTDHDGLSHTQTLAIDIKDVNEAPTAIQLSANTIAENSAIGTEIGLLAASDVDASQTFTYTITENENFEIEGDKLVSKASFDFETLDSYSVEIKVADQDGLSHTQTLTIAVVDVNEKPTDIYLSDNKWFENSPIGTVIGEMTAVDEDANQTFTFTNIDPAFDVVGNKLVSNTELDREALDEYLSGTALNIVVTDQDGETYKKLFEIYYTDVNETPTAIQLSNHIIFEDSASGEVVGRFTATDEDRHETFTYSLPENDYFIIDDDQLLAKGNLNYEEATSHALEITVSDQGGLSHTQSFTISVIDVNEAPVFTSEAITEGVEAVEYVYTVECMDIDGDAISLLAIDKPEWLSLVDNADGASTLSGIPTQGGLYHVILEAKDSEFTVQQEFDIEVEVVTGIEPDITASTVNIYPNPVADELYIDLTNFKGQELSMSLYSLTGKLIFKEVHQSIGEEVSIRKSLQYLQSGMYLLMIENDGSRKTYKIVKK